MAEKYGSPAQTLDRGRVFERAWAARGQTMWGIGALGLGSGAVVGLIAPFFPALVGAESFAAAASVVPQSLAVFSALGMTTGFGIGATVGLAAGASAGALQELPHQGSVKTEEGPQNWRDTLATYVNPKVGAIVATLGMIGGAVMGAAYLALSGSGAAGATSWAMPAMDMLMGKAAAQSTLGVMSYFIGLMGSFGAMWCFNYPKIAGHFHDIAQDLISGKTIGAPWGPQPEKAQETAVAPAKPARERVKPVEGPSVAVLASELSASSKLTIGYSQSA